MMKNANILEIVKNRTRNRSFDKELYYTNIKENKTLLQNLINTIEIEKEEEG
jgi:hypothetical protein